MIKRKLNAKYTEKAIEEEHVEILEQALRENMEDLVQEELDALKNNLVTVKEESDKNPSQSQTVIGNQQTTVLAP